MSYYFLEEGLWWIKVGLNADAILNNSSTSSVTGTLRSDPGSGNGNVDYWGVVDIWDDYQLYDVLPGGAGLLVRLSGRTSGVDGVRCIIIYRKRNIRNPMDDLIERA